MQTERGIPAKVSDLEQFAAFQQKQQSHPDEPGAVLVILVSNTGVLLGEWVSQHRRGANTLSTPTHQETKKAESALKRFSEHTVSGKKKEPKPKLFGPDIFGWGEGLLRERVGAQKIRYVL